MGRRTLEGTRAAARTVIRYRNGVLNGRGASLLDGYMEDLATDRIYRLMLAQRLRHHERVTIAGDDGQPVAQTRELLGTVFDESLTRLVTELPTLRDAGTPATLREARRLSEEMIHRGWFNPA